MQHFSYLGWASAPLVQGLRASFRAFANATTKKNASGLHASVRNAIPEKPSGFSKEKPPDPT
jgi:hypothetical protein